MTQLPTHSELQKLRALADEEKCLRPRLHISDFACVKAHKAPSFERMVAMIEAQQREIERLSQ